MPVDCYILSISNNTNFIVIKTVASSLNIQVVEYNVSLKEVNSTSYSKPNNWCNVTINLRNNIVEWFLDGVKQTNINLTNSEWFRVHNSHRIRINSDFNVFLISDLRIWNRCLDISTILKYLFDTMVNTAVVPNNNTPTLNDLHVLTDNTTPGNNTVPPPTGGAEIVSFMM